jgi:phosphate transport system substrate-binding protein
MAVKIQKGGWALVFLIGLALVGYTLQRYGVIDFTKLTQGHLPGVGSGSSDGLILRVHGSNTIGAQLLPALAEAFLTQKGATGIKTVPNGKDEVLVQGALPGQSSPQSIEIAAHGSATAFADLQDAKCDVGAASRQITAEEAARLRSLGDMTSPASERVLGLDGIAVIVSAGNSIRSLSKEDIRKAFAGEINDWSQLGRPEPGVIVLYARDEKSGTWDTFKTLVLGDTPLAATASRIEDSRQLSDRVAGDPNGIGFVGLPFVRSAKALAVSDAGTNPVFPTALTVATEDYPLSRRLYLYVPGNSHNAEAREFISFALSKAGQDLVSENGFVGQTVVPSPMVAVSSQLSGGSEVERRYVRMTQGAVRLPLDFRFRSGSSALDNKALDDLGRVATFVGSPQYAGQNIVLMGFADSMGARQKNDELSQQRAGIIAEEFKARGIKVSEVIGFGAERPVASNATPEGREKNRRVEVWLRKQ